MGAKAKFDFSGWATKNDMLCEDGLTIRHNAFVEDDGKKVPLVYGHDHHDPENVLGHAYLENRDEGVYAYCAFNDTERAQHAKELVEHGDITALSIYANKLKKKGNDVMHGIIREVSLVMAGANPGALIDFPVVAHGDGNYEIDEEEAVIYSGEELDLTHGELLFDDDDEDDTKEDDLEHESKNGGKTLQDVFDTLNEEQKTLVYALVGEASKGKDDDSAEHSFEGGDESMKSNVFDQTAPRAKKSLSDLTSTEVQTIIHDAMDSGSLKQAVLAHSQDYGIENLDVLLPDAKNVGEYPFVKNRDQEWVTAVLNGTSHQPFSRIKTTVADWSFEEARARGYIKGHEKKEEVVSLMKRITTPTTIYKKQKLDRDDIIDITTLDIVSWIKGEMRVKLNEEIARAILVGDGRDAEDEDKINEDNLRPIISEDDLFKMDVTIDFPSSLTDYDSKVRYLVRAMTKARKDYKGSGAPSLFTNEQGITDVLLMEDQLGHRIYKTESEVNAALRVSRTVAVPDFLENITKTINGKTYYLFGIIVNLKDYTIGADKGGNIEMFNDFDIDFNQYKYLMETRISGCLTKPYSAQVIWVSEVLDADMAYKVYKNDDPTGFKASRAFTKVKNPVAEDLGKYYERVYSEDPKINHAATWTYEKTKDTEIVEGKDYYTKDSEAAG